MNTGAVILCGGESKRMGHPKAWLPFGNERMLERVVRLVGKAAAPIVVVGAPGQDLPELPSHVKIVRDVVAGRGPLQGLAAGLAALPEDVELAYATGTDAPFLEPRWIARLANLSEGHDLVIPFAGSHHHPLAALYRRRTVLPVIGRLLGENGLGLYTVIDAVKTRVVAEHELRAVDPALQTLRNLNTFEDYREALADLGLNESGACSSIRMHRRE